MTTRKLQQIIPALPASEGAGVKLMRSLGSANHLRLDPFLMLDGHMLHEDHLGNRGNLKSGGVLGPGDRFEVKAGVDGARFLLLAARPLEEPVVQYGPFVMNTREEIKQAIRDYQSGVLTRTAA